MTFYTTAKYTEKSIYNLHVFKIRHIILLMLSSENSSTSIYTVENDTKIDVILKP